jgi:hypothetical protein
MTLDDKLRWKEHIKKKRDELNIKKQTPWPLVRKQTIPTGRPPLVGKSSASSSGKCIGCLDAILSCQSTIKSYYTSKLYVVRVMLR